MQLSEQLLSTRLGLQPAYVSHWYIANQGEFTDRILVLQWIRHPLSVLEEMPRTEQTLLGSL